MRVILAGSSYADTLKEQREANTDFFELYWAYQFRDTRLSHLISWLKPLVLRRRASLAGERLKGPDGRRYTIQRIVTFVLGLVACCLAVSAALGGPWWYGVLAAVLALVVVGAALGLGLVFTIRIVVLLVLALRRRSSHRA
jgi:hypothetical protein